MNDGLICVLDVGTSKVTAIVAELESGEVLDLATAQNRGVQRGVVTDLDETTRAISEAMMVTRAYPVPPQVIVSVNGSHVEGINSQGFVPIWPPNRAILREDILHVVNHSRQVMPSPDREQIMATPREFRVDGQRGVMRPVGMSGNHLEVLTHLVTGQIAHLHNLERTVEAAGYQVAELVPAPYAAGLALLSPQQREVGTVVVDLGAGTTGVSIFTGNSLAWTSVIPVGGSHVTSDLVKLLKASPEEAERVKCQHARAVVGKVKEDSTVEIRQIGHDEPRHLHRRVLYEIVESRAREIATLVRQQIERSGHYGMLPGGFVLTGGMSQMPGVPQLMAAVLGEASVHLGSPKCAGPAGVRASNPEFSVAAGLVAHARLEAEASLEPASGFSSWKERFLTLFQIVVN